MKPPSDMVAKIEEAGAFLYQLFQREGGKYVAHIYHPWPARPGQTHGSYMREGRSKREAIERALSHTKEVDPWGGL